LGAIYVLTLRRKLDVIIDAGKVDLTTKWETFVRRAVDSLEQTICRRFDALSSPTDTNGLWRELARELPQFVSRFVSLFHKYDFPATEYGYYPLRPESISELRRNLAIEDQPKLTWLMLVIAALHEGVRVPYWSFSASTGLEGKHGQLELLVSGRRISIFVVPDSGSGKAKLTKRNFIDPSSGTRAAVIYATGLRPTSASHAPHRAFPFGPASVGPAEIWIQDLAERHSDSRSLLFALRHELLCA